MLHGLQHARGFHQPVIEQVGTERDADTGQQREGKDGARYDFAKHQGDVKTATSRDQSREDRKAKQVRGRR